MQPDKLLAQGFHLITLNDALCQQHWLTEKLTS